MELIPVVDILDGVVVHGVSGHREHYEPVRSVLTDSKEPVAVLKALLQAARTKTAYVADLNALTGQGDHRCLIAEMARTGAHLIVDAGCRSAESVRDWLAAGAEQVILPTETLSDPEQAASCFSATCDTQLITGLDLVNGAVRSEYLGWDGRDPQQVLGELLALGAPRTVLVLDVRTVGTNAGPSTCSLLSQMRGTWTDVRFISGGGVRSEDDLRALQDVGCAAALVASALHTGQLPASKAS